MGGGFDLVTIAGLRDAWTYDRISTPAFDSISEKARERKMEQFRTRSKPSWKIVVLWVLVLAPVVWAIYFTLESSLKMMAR